MSLRIASKLHRCPHIGLRMGLTLLAATLISVDSVLGLLWGIPFKYSLACQ